MKATAVPEGHERLTREAVAGMACAPNLPCPRNYEEALRYGVRRPDTEKLSNHIAPDQQKRHALRKDFCQPSTEALDDIIRQLRILHRGALSAWSRGERNTAFQLIGEALHLIQDSYSPAHVERVSGSDRRFPIVYIRYYGFLGDGAPREHGFPFDARDLVSHPFSETLLPWAQVAKRASAEFLQIMMQHLARPSDAANQTRLQGFINRHLFLGARRTEPRSIYPVKCLVVPSVPWRL